MADLDTAERNKLKDTDFAYVDRDGKGHLPIHDESHVRNAIARFNQTDFDSGTAKKRAAGKVVAAAKKHGVDVADDDEVAKAAKG